jgi:hypothetical protein
MIELVFALFPSGARNLFNVRTHLRMKQMAHQFLVSHLMSFLF